MLELWKNVWLQRLFYNRIKVFQGMDGCNSFVKLINPLFERNNILNKNWKWPPEILTVHSKSVAVSTPLKQQYSWNRNICQNTLHMQQWMVAVLFWNKYVNTSLNNKGWLELFLGPNTVTFKKKMILTIFPSWITAIFCCFCESVNSWSRSM